VFMPDSLHRRCKCYDARLNDPMAVPIPRVRAASSIQAFPTIPCTDYFASALYRQWGMSSYPLPSSPPPHTYTLECWSLSGDNGCAGENWREYCGRGQDRATVQLISSPCTVSFLLLRSISSSSFTPIHISVFIFGGI